MRILQTCWSVVCGILLWRIVCSVILVGSVSWAGGTLTGPAGGPGPCPLEDIVTNAVTATAGANTSGIAAQGAGLRVYLDQAILVNTGTANGSMIITDGTGGTTMATIPFPASTGTTAVFKTPIPFSLNTAIFVDPTGSDDIKVTLIGCKRAL